MKTWVLIENIAKESPVISFGLAMHRWRLGILETGHDGGRTEIACLEIGLRAGIESPKVGRIYGMYEMRKYLETRQDITVHTSSKTE